LSSMLDFNWILYQSQRLAKNLYLKLSMSVYVNVEYD
jgi:hypothetical protein